MKTPKWKLVLFASLCVWRVLSPSAHGALTRPALVLTANPGSGADYSLGDGGHKLLFNVNAAGTLTPVTASTGSGFAFYSVANLTVFDVNYVQSNQPFSGNVGNGNGSLATILNVPFYLGYYIQSGNPSQSINANANDGYGWAELLRGTSGLSLIDSALQNPSGGIIVGTTTAVPEPMTWIFLAGGALILFTTKAVGMKPSQGGSEHSGQPVYRDGGRGKLPVACARGFRSSTP